MKVGVIMILRIMLKDERFKKGYRQVTKEFKTYSDLTNYLQFNKDRIYGQVKNTLSLTKEKLK